jgi:hypothetical protein
VDTDDAMSKLESRRQRRCVEPLLQSWFIPLALFPCDLLFDGRSPDFPCKEGKILDLLSSEFLFLGALVVQI